MGGKGFEHVWEQTLSGIKQTRGALSPLPELKPLLATLYKAACRRPIIEPELDDAIVRLLEYLSSPTGQTHDNCWVVGNFLMPGDEYWEADWGELPARYEDVLGIMGHELWQAVENPEWCENFGGMPHQLLAQFNNERDTPSESKDDTA